MGEVVRRLVARTMAQQLGPQVEAATAPFQHAFSTRAGSLCVAHVIQGLCEVNLEASVISIDGICAFDQISRCWMGCSRDVEERPSRLLQHLPRCKLTVNCSAVHRQFTSGKMLKEWNIPFFKGKVASRGIH